MQRQAFRGSDVRLDLGSLFRPDSFPRRSIDPSRWLWHAAQAYAFDRKEHINILELRALIHSFEGVAPDRLHGGVVSSREGKIKRPCVELTTKHPSVGPIFEVEMLKSARHCGAKHISKSKC